MRRDGSGKYAIRCDECERGKKQGQQKAAQERQRERQRNKPSKIMSRSVSTSTSTNDYELEFRKMRLVIRQRSRHQCEARTEACVGAGEHIHHRKLRSQGGTNSANNLIDVCTPCHNWIHAHPALSYERGWLIHGYADETPLE